MRKANFLLPVLFFLITAPAAFGASFASVKKETAETPILTLRIDSTTQNLSTTDMNAWINSKTDLGYNANYSSEIENTNFCHYSKSIICGLTFSLQKNFHIKKISQNTPSFDSIRKFSADLARQVNRDPKNATFSMEDSRVSVFSLSEKGLKLDEEKSAQIIFDFLSTQDYPLKENKALDLAYEKIDPEITTDSVENLGISDLLGEGKSNFRGSPKNRIHNINVATGRFNGILIKPGEEFSFVKALGDVDEEHGYKAELVIKKDKTEPEFGGGICQVSTTAFRAAIYSGLEITARRNHAYPVSYYNPQGMDSTVYIPRPDLRFKNDTPGYILIQTKIEGTQLTFQFFGKSDERKTEVIGPKVLERKEDGAMKTTFTQKVTDRDGKIIREDVFNSNYDSPSKYPHPGDTLSEKPKGWSKKQWDQYKEAHNLR